MSDPQAPPMLQTVVGAYELRGRAVLGDLQDHAALVHCGEALPDQAWGFQTRAVAAPWDTRVALALVRSGAQINPEVLAKAGAVYAIAKRPGGPFPDRIGVGRARTADISLRSPSVSKYHAYFTCEEGRREWSVVDARSRNGTRVGERRLEAGDPAKLANGAQLMFGDETFLFFTPDGFRQVLDSLAQPA
jgi:hypothetical protein